MTNQPGREEETKPACRGRPSLQALRRWAARRLPASPAPGYAFDTLAQDLARGVPRRTVLRQLGGAFAAAFLAELTGFLALDPTPAAAAPSAAPNPCTSSKTLPCLNQAQGALADTLAGCYPETLDQGSLSYWLAEERCLEGAAQGYQLDRGQCLGPGAGCPTGSECSSDLCCPKGQVGCGVVCCAAGQSCTNGQCSGGPGCGAGLTACGGACVNLQSDAQHCGACGTACATGQRCASGVCQAGCAAGQTTCGGVCVNLQTDNNHCSGCGQSCPSGQSCVNGACGLACPSGQTPCSGACVNLQSNLNNCGACGHVCPGGVPCIAGKCCKVGGQVCGGDAECCSGHCALVNFVPTCSVCPAGQTSCNGVCVKTTGPGADVNNCGACGRACPPTKCIHNFSGTTAAVQSLVGCDFGTCFYGGAPECAAGQACVNGACGPCTRDPDCPAAFQSCCNGVCVSDENNCGACGHVCPGGVPCINGKCCKVAGQVCGGDAECCSGRCVLVNFVPICSS